MLNVLFYINVKCIVCILTDTSSDVASVAGRGAPHSTPPFVPHSITKAPLTGHLYLL